MTDETEEPIISVEQWLRIIETQERTQKISSDRKVLTKGLKMRSLLRPLVALDLRFNCIPGEPGDKCFMLLIVFVGTKDSLELYLEKAVNHVAVSCPGTKYVIIYAAQWNSRTWFGIKQKFEKIRQQRPRLTVVLKMVGLDPLVLIP